MSNAEAGPRSSEMAKSWFLGRVHAQRLSPTQRRVVQYMLDSLPEVAFASTIDVAEAAGVSQPTVARIATALGFSGYSEFRAAVRDAVLAASATAPDDAHASKARLALSSEIANLQALQETVEDERMRSAVDLLAASRPLGVAGLRASAALAHYFGYFAQRVLPDVRVLDDAATLDDNVLQLQEDGGSALLVFAMPRYPAATVRALATARQLGLATVAIVDTPLVPFAELIDVALVAPVGSDLVFDSHAATTALSMAVLDALASREPRRTQERLEAHERLIDGWVLQDR